MSDLATFPNFTSLGLSDRGVYDAHVKGCPPISDLSFATLMIWWNVSGNGVPVALLNDNLVISYEIPDDEENSGLSIVGEHMIDESFDRLFEQQKSQGDTPRLVHVPEFVVHNLQAPDRYKIVEERDYFEYIIPVSNLYPLEGASHAFRRRVKRFMEEIAQDRIDVRELDLTQKTNQQLLVSKLSTWVSRYEVNDAEQSELKVLLQATIPMYKDLGMKNMCLFIDGELHGIQLYQVSVDGKYFILNHLKVSHAYRFMVPYVEFQIAHHAANEGIGLLNYEMDLGRAGLRTYKQELHPVDYFKKFRIEPRN